MGESFRDSLYTLAAYNGPWHHPERKLPIMNTPEPQQLALSRMQGGPIRHEFLADDLLEVIGTVHRRIGKYLGMNLEQFEIGFMREKTPAIEVAVWNSITVAWDKFHQKYVGRMQLPLGEEKTLIAALVAISMGVQKAESLGVPVIVGVRLLDCFDEALGP